MNTNHKGLKRLVTTYSGMVFAGKKPLTFHDTITEEVFVIENKTDKLVLTKNEVEELILDILKSYKGEKFPNLRNYISLI